MGCLGKRVLGNPSLTPQITGKYKSTVNNYFSYI